MFKAVRETPVIAPKDERIPIIRKHNEIPYKIVDSSTLTGIRFWRLFKINSTSLFKPTIIKYIIEITAKPSNTKKLESGKESGQILPTRVNKPVINRIGIRE
jgi:hypothetical protein